MRSSPNFESREEARAFDHYLRQTSVILGGDLDESFWNNLVLRLSLAEPAVKHAVLAISNLHEKLDTAVQKGREVTLDNEGFSLVEYGKAITALRQWRPSEVGDSLLPLLLCILFICIEFLKGNEHASQLHISQGRTILAGLDNVDSASMDMIKQSLVPIFTRLSLASVFFARKPAAIPNFLKQSRQNSSQFNSLAQARNVLYNIMDEALQFFLISRSLAFDPSVDEAQKEASRQNQESLLARLEQWNVEFAAFSTLLVGQLSTTQQLLNIYFHAAKIWIAVSLDPTELVYDNHLASFSAIITNASAIVNTLSRKTPPNGLFSFETELLAPVYWATIKCRHPSLRRAGLRLLERPEMRKRRENLWTTEEIVAVASRVIIVEESGSFDSPSQVDSRDIPMDTVEGLGYPREVVEVSIYAPPRVKTPPSYLDDSAEESSASEYTTTDQSPRSMATEESTPIALGTFSTSLVSSLPVEIEEHRLVSPFGVPEHLRVKDAAIGPRQGDGTWVTMFRDPPPGETVWETTREFLSI